ncbi:cytochrome c-type biogenesis CcmH-like mitochondrial protein isoform X2 [Physcomitrium patens]|uniref:Cytochrome c-type biogenesis protein n=1 Tax=Physcomitrium patens TaxID=3218 RepID=A0A7I4DJY7_PHYPA|nr:cytochrome c-type biogenesis CcmH-like mitochondrial protein isoform X2 [Physcomitrium patens]|eukprot:XP_024370972.1 cytochrome c-type biogenesis CcmH-like mitochondrial protein isoform X2 [Physcomitrella patens]
MADDDTHSSSVEDRVRAAQVEARARHISHNVRCLECGHQSIEESAADIAVRLRKVIRDDIRAGKTDNEIYERLTTEYGETILYSPAFDAQTAVLWLGPEPHFIVEGRSSGMWVEWRMLSLKASRLPQVSTECLSH